MNGLDTYRLATWPSSADDVSFALACVCICHCTCQLRKSSAFGGSGQIGNWQKVQNASWIYACGTRTNFWNLALVCRVCVAGHRYVHGADQSSDA